MKTTNHTIFTENKNGTWVYSHNGVQPGQTFKSLKEAQEHELSVTKGIGTCEYLYKTKNGRKELVENISPF